MQPSSTTTTSPTSSTPKYTNTVQAGQNLSTIAQNAGLLPQQFLALNPHLGGSNSTYQGLNNNVAVGTGYNLAAPTVVSNENKVTAANDIINKQSTYQSGPTTTVGADGNTTTTHADGSAYTPSTPPAPVVQGQGGYYGNVYYAPGSAMPKDANGNTVTLNDKPDNYIDWNAMKSQFDATGVQQLANIEATYNNLIQQQQQANKGAEANVSNALLQAGITGQGSSSQYAPVSSQGIITSQVNYGLQQIQTLNAQKQAAITAAQQAIQQGDFQYAEKAQAQADKLAKQQQDAMDKINNDLIEAQKQTAKDNAIIDQVANGTMDAATIYQNIKKSGNSANITLKDITDTLKSIAPNTDTIKLANGNTVLIDKVTGKIISNLGGAKSTAVNQIGEGAIPVIRTVSVGGTQKPVSGYTLVAGDDPYLIAQKYGISMDEMKQLNPDVKDWYNLQPGFVLNVPDKSTGSSSILAATGLSVPAFSFLTQGPTALTRMSATQRLQYMNEAENFLNKKGVDLSTFRSQYGAIGKTVEANVLRNNQSAVAEAEIDATLKNLTSAAQEAGLGNLASLNIAKIWSGQQLNNADASTFKFHLNQLREEFAMYNAALAGQIDANGNIRQTSGDDYKRADEIIQNGFAKGSISGFENALENSRSKMQEVLKNSIDAQNKQVWNLFGVGDKYQSHQQEVQKSTDPLQNIRDYGNKHPEQQATIIKMKQDGISVQDISNWINQQPQ